jgi:lysozyme
VDLKKLKTQLRLHEGSRLKPYKDSVGKLTIGVGRNLDDVGISQEEEELFLSNDIERARILASSLVRNWDALGEIRQRVLIDMAFNLGYKLRYFRNFIAAVNLSLWDLAAKEMRNSMWATQVKSRADRLIQMMESGKDYE